HTTTTHISFTAIPILTLSQHNQHCYHSIFFFFNATATTEIYTLSLHDALPIWSSTTETSLCWPKSAGGGAARSRIDPSTRTRARSEEHTSELQSLRHLVCRLLLEKKKTS